MSGLQQPARGGHDGEGLLGRISTEMVQLMKQYFGKGPTKAKAYFLDDFLIAVMRGGMTRAEQTMLEADREDAVREFRQQFENEMTGPMTGLIEELTGRKVINYQSQVVFDPDISVEFFFFDDVIDQDLLKETARALTDSAPVKPAGDVRRPPTDRPVLASGRLARVHAGGVGRAAANLVEVVEAALGGALLPEAVVSTS